ncbi:MAG: peptide deformylase [Acidithiobacillales bacterium SG8_45]|jgi:peptide deformylase|nr:MAG: peptide deformylase [Acidithiobacillales bacterium SG8_45]
MGDPLLLQPSQPVTEFSTPELDALIADMFDTMHAQRGAGLAAPQIGIMKRVVIFGVEANPRYPDAESVPTTVLINPIIEPIGDDADLGWEGCLSVPGMRGLVSRYTHIRYRGMNEKGETIERTASDFHARVVQHECDHLDGVLYPMRIQDMRYFGFEEVLFPDL